MPALIEALRDPDPGMRWRAAEALRHIGPSAAAAAPALVEAALRDPNEDVCEAATEALGQTSIPVPALIEALRDPDAGVRLRAARVLSRIRWGPNTVGALIEALDDPEEDVRKAAEETLNARAEQMEEALGLQPG